MIGEKTRWKLHKNVMCCFEQILVAVPRKRPLTSHLTNHTSKMSRTCRTLLEKDKLISNVFLRTPPIHEVGWPGKIYIHQLCADTRCRLRTWQEQWLIGMDDKRESGECMLSAHLDDEDLAKVLSAQKSIQLTYLYFIIIIIISCWQHGYPWPSLATPPYRSSP